MKLFKLFTLLALCSLAITAHGMYVGMMSMSKEQCEKQCPGQCRYQEPPPMPKKEGAGLIDISMPAQVNFPAGYYCQQALN